MTGSNTKDPAFKLFGMKIPLPADDESPPIPGEDLSPSMDREDEVEKTEKDCPLPQVPDTDQEDDVSPRDTKESVDHDSLAETNVNPKTPSISEESAKLKASETEKEQNDATDSQEKPLKKPDKILPCPRCNSMDTKFCYYNNYNVNQPRHFCKACQRYWTAGGTMRNVPVGAGRRKNKNSASHYHHITISEALQAARVEAPNGMHHPALKANGGVLSFGLDAPICDSMATVLNLADEKSLNGIRNSLHSIEEQRILVPYRFGENGDDCSSSSSVTFANSVDDGGRACPREHVSKSMNGFASPIPYVHGVPWPYPWNSAMPPHHFFPPGYPMTLFPAAAYWNCGNPGAWYMSLPSPQSSSSSNQKTISSGPDSPTLGKHSRDDDTLKPEGLSNDEKSKYKNGCVLVPKTLRIDDPMDAAKSSSIWTTLGIKNETFSGGKMFKAFESKSAEKNHTAEISPALWANPAALSRSITFHESS